MSTKRILTSYIQYTVQYSGDLTVPFPRYWGRGGEDGKSYHNPGLKWEGPRSRCLGWQSFCTDAALEFSTCYVTRHEKLVGRQFSNTDLYNYMGRGAGVGANDLQFRESYVVNTA